MPGRYKLEGYGTYEIDSDDDAEIQSTISEIIAHEKAARASRPALGGPTGLASKRLAALGGKPESEKGDFAPQPSIAGNAIPAIQPVNRPAIPEEPDAPSALLTPELQSFFRKNKQEALRKARENTFPSVGEMAGNVADWAGRQKAALDADLDREAAAQAAEDAAGEARHDKYIAPLERRVGDILTGAGAAAREAIGGYGDVSPDATPIQRARLRRTPAPDLAGGGVRKYEPPKAGEPYLPLGAGVEQYRPVSEQAAARLAALRSGDDGTVRRENARPLFEGKALGEAPATFRLNPEDTLRATAPARYLENDYTKVHDWAQGAADDLGKWATEDTEHSALARLVDRGEKSDSLTANVLAAGAKGVTQAITSSAPALAEFAVLHRATPGAFKPLVDAAITSWFSGEGVGQVAEASPAVGTDIGSAIGGDPVPFNELAQHLGQLGMGAFMGATPLGAKSPIAKSIEGNRFLDPGLASGRSPEQARLYGEATRGQADREMASRAISVEEGTPMIGAFNRQPMTAPLTSMAGDAWDFLSNRQQPAVEALRRPRQRGGLWQDAGLRSPHDTMTAPAEPEASFTGPIDVFDLAAGRRPTPYAPEMGPETWEGIVPRLAPFEPPVGPPVPYSARERLANAQLLEGQGPPDLSRAERAMHSIPSGPEGQIRGPFPMPADVLAQGRTPPADLQARTGNAPRPAPPIDPEAARVLASILSGGEEPPPAPALQARPPLPTVGDAPSWQDRQRAERASPAKPPAEENIQVEPKATTDAQLKMVDEGQGQPGKKPGVLYTVQGGAKPPDVVPEGLARVDGPAGTLIFDPSKVTPEQAREALTSGEGLDKALGFSGPRPEPHPDNAVVSVLGKDGVEKSSQVAGPGDIEGAVKAAQGMAGEGDQVAVRTPDEVIADRQAGIEAEKKPPLDLKGAPAKVREHADGNVAAAGDSRVVTLRGDRGDAFVVHESANEPGAWQLTHLDKDGSPTGHRLFKSREDAIRSASGQVVRGDPSSVGSGYKVERRVEDKGPEGRLHFVDVGQIAQDYKLREMRKLNEALDVLGEKRRISNKEQADAEHRARIAERIAAEQAHAERGLGGGVPDGDEAGAGAPRAPEGMVSATGPERGPAPEATRAPEPELPPAAEPVIEPIAERGVDHPLVRDTERLAAAVDALPPHLKRRYEQLQARYDRTAAKLARAKTPAERDALGDKLDAVRDEIDDFENDHVTPMGPLSEKDAAGLDAHVQKSEPVIRALAAQQGIDTAGLTVEQIRSKLQDKIVGPQPSGEGRVFPMEPRKAGAEEPVEPPAAEAPKGKPARIWVTPKEPLDVEYKIVEADTVHASHDVNGLPNPLYEGHQPRGRDKAAAIEQMRGISNGPNPHVLMESPGVVEGAPVVREEVRPDGPRHFVESGSGRTAGVQEAYRKGTAEDYRAAMVENAEKYGESPDAVAAMQKPMLVRKRRVEMTAEEQRRFAQDANKPVGLQMSTAETATVDADRLTPATMALFNPSDTGDIMAASNRPFIDRFMEDVVTPEERAALVTRDGMISPDGIRRIQNAVVTKAYGSGRMVERALEGGAKTDATLAKNVVTGLMRAASSVAKSRGMVEAGEAHDVGFLGPIEEAVAKLAELRRDGQSVADYLDQSDMFGDPLTPEGRQVLSIFEANNRAPNKIAAYISSVARAVEGSGVPGMAEKPSIAEIYSAARNDYEARHGAQGDLFERAEPVQAQAVPPAGSEGTRSLFDSGPDGGDGGGGAPGGGRPGGGEPGGKPRVFAYSSGKGVGRDPYAERTGKQAVPVPTFKRLPRTPPVRPPEGPLEVLKAENLDPVYARVKDGVRELKEDIHEVFSAVSVDDSAKRFSGIHRKSKAQADYRLSRLEQATRPLRRMFDKVRPKDRMAATVDFFQTGEERRKQPTPELEKQWHLFHAITEASWREIEQYGHDGIAGYLTDVDYVPRHFKKPEAAAKFAHEWYERRSIEGDKGFLKKRFHEFLRDALESGLQLEYDNPADALKANIASVQHYLGWQKVKGDLIRSRIIRYEPIADMADRREGYDVIHPTKGVVFGDAAVQVGEAVTKRFVALEKLLDKLGIQHDRLPGVGGEFGRAEYGGEAGEGKIVSRFGSPVGVVAHELGHILDQRYGLQDALLKSVDAGAAIRRELGTLADMRFESKPTVSQGYKDYVRSGDEKIANFLDAFVAEPTLARAVAPVTLGEFRKFLLDKPELHEFFDMSPGLELEERVTRIPINGKVIAGHWIAPRAVVKLIDRSLTPGLQNKIVYRSFRNLTNAMNQVQLGFSMFHPIFTGLDSIQSTVALAVQQAMEATKPENAGKGFGADALKSAGRALVAPVLLVKEGAKIRKMARDLPIGMPFEQMPEVIQNHLRSGGSFWQDSHYSTGQIDAFRRSLDRANPFGAALHLPGAIFEAAAWPVMEWWVPNIKAGLFAQEAAFELKRLGPDATGAEIDYHLGRIQDSVENRAGQLRYDNLLWNRTMKDLGQVVFRSLGWNLGGIREVGGGIFDAGRTSIRYKANAEVEAAKKTARLAIEQAKKDLSAVQQSGGKAADIEKAEAAVRRAEAAMPSNLNDETITRRMVYAATLPITVGAMGGLYYWMKHGKPPTNVKDMFAIPTGGRNKDGSEERVFLPTYAKDEYAWFKDPFSTFLHKLSPGLSVIKDIARNEDYFGTQVREGNLAEQARDSLGHAIRQMVPMSARQYMNSRFPGSEIGLAEASLGITKAPASLSRSDAEEKLNEYLHRTSGGIKTKAEAEKSKTRSEIKALIRGGHDEAADAAIEKAIEEHQVSPDEKQGRRALYKAAAKTVLENTLRSMPVDEALEVYRKATPEERQRWADAFRARVFGSASRRPSWWKDRPQEEVEAIQAEAEKLLPPE